MPLQSGKSNATRSSNIKELVDSWKQKGSIGTSHPKDKKAAIQQAIAISYAKAREGKRK